MATITTILGTDQPRDSRTVINTNFSNLNSDKIETSVIDTDGTLTANSDSKIPSQKAVKTYVNATSTGVNTGDQFTNVGASKLLGRGSASGAGAAQEITLGTNLTMTGTTLDAAGGGGGGKSFIMSSIFEHITRLNATDYLGTSTVGTNGLAQTTTSSNESYSKITPALGGAGTGKILRDGLTFTYQGYLTGNGAGYDAFIGLGDPTFNDGGLSANSARIGFYIKRRSSGSIELFASCASGSAKTETLLTTLTIDQSFDLKITYNTTGPSVDFYWAKNDGALSSATNISTNLPSTLSNRLTIGISNALAGTTAMGLYSGFSCVQY